MKGFASWAIALLGLAAGACGSDEKPASTQAVEQTAGVVLFYKGRIADAVYGTNSGGVTASDDDVWRGKPTPYLRGVPPGLPFVWAERTLAHGLNFTLTTALGDLDLLGEIVGGGGYDALEPHTVMLTVFGHQLLCLGLEKLIHVKRAAGRPKDFEAVAELELILARR